MRYDAVKHLVQFSGGIGSFAATEAVIRKHGHDNVRLLFADTLIEDPDLYRFLDDAERYFKVPLTRISEGRTPWEVFRDKRFIGNSRVTPCSRILKVEFAKAYIEKHYAPEETILYVGIDWSEAHRMKKITRNWAPYEIRAPLCEPPFLQQYDKETYLAYLENVIQIRRPYLYTLGLPHNNCGGCCVKAGKAHWLHVLNVLPERYAEWEAQEANLAQHLMRPGQTEPFTILREQRKGNLRYISLQELRERQEEERKTEEGQAVGGDWGGCGCFTDEVADEV